MKPEGNWPTFTEDEAGLYVRRLGNLTLMRTSDNSNLRSEPFAGKRASYAASPYVLTSQVADAEDWTPATIADRQKQLAELAVETWPL